VFHHSKSFVKTKQQRQQNEKREKKQRQNSQEQEQEQNSAEQQPSSSLEAAKEPSCNLLSLDEQLDLFAGALIELYLLEQQTLTTHEEDESHC
jgi:hypothetical protein